jgi:hypothetical protein
MKRLCVAILLALVVTAGAMTTAKAATTVANFGILGIGGSGLIARPNSSPLGAVPAGVFEDDYLFQVNAIAAGSALLVELNQFGRDITGLTLKLFSNTPSPVEIDSDTGVGVLEVAAASLTSGVQYFVRVSGTAGAAGGQYLGGLSIVPVPAALPLMLGALAGLGLIARRKTDA